MLILAGVDLHFLVRRLRFAFFVDIYRLGNGRVVPNAILNGVFTCFVGGVVVLSTGFVKHCAQSGKELLRHFLG